jgi:Domain of unknown function DUF29
MISKLYESDFWSWTQEQAKLLRLQKWDLVDIENLIEEVETLGRQERKELRNRLGVLIGHLLKWQFQPERRGNSWLATIREQRREVNTLLQESPSLKPYLSEAIQSAYEAGLDLAVRETYLSYEIFPSICPYNIEQILDAKFLPV